jgi:hypothetical protein
MLKEKSILLISPEKWGDVFVSKHHYARSLAERGNNVFFLNPPTYEWKFLRLSDRLTIIDYPGFIKGINHLPGSFRRFLYRRKYSQAQLMLNTRFDVVWSFDSSVFYDFDFLPNDVLKIYHLVDLNQNFRNEIGASTSNVCFCTTELIRQRLIPFQPNVFKVHHGVQSSVTPKNFAPYEPPGINSIKIGYIGNLTSKYTDWETLYATAFANLNADFIFVGPEGSSNISQSSHEHMYKERIKTLPNVFFRPPVQSSEIPSFLGQVDIVLVCYKAEFWKESASPHKVMEYICSGKVIVATYTDEYKYYPGLLEMTEKNSELPDLVGKVIRELDFYNSPKKLQQRRNFADDNAYAKQLDRIEEILNRVAK